MPSHNGTKAIEELMLRGQDAFLKLALGSLFLILILVKKKKSYL